MNFAWYFMCAHAGRIFRCSRGAAVAFVAEVEATRPRSILEPRKRPCTKR